MTSKINKSWEKERMELHSPKGVEKLREAVRTGLKRKYYGIAKSMFRYEGMDDEMFRDMNLMSRNNQPEGFIFQGDTTAFMIGDQVHFLPMVMEGGINIYGNPNTWRAVPIGWNETGINPPTHTSIHDRILGYDDAVVFRNGIEPGSDQEYIDSQIDMMVDNLLTVNQLQLIAKAPFIFNVPQGQELSAKNYFLAICEDKPVIFKYMAGDQTQPVIEKTDVKIDPAIFEIADRIECNILEFLGFPCVPITKRAQQSVSEVNSNDDKIRLRRTEKLHQREMSVQRMNDLFGTHVRVVSVIDEVENEREMDGETDAVSDGTDEGPNQEDEEVCS